MKLGAKRVSRLDRRCLIVPTRTYSWKRARQSVITPIGIGVILTLLLTAPGGLARSSSSGSPNPPSSSSRLSADAGPACALASEGSGQFWTPDVLADSPYLGSVTGSSTVSNYGTFSFSDGLETYTSSGSSSSTATVSESSGNAAGEFQLDTWYVYRLHSTAPGGGWCNYPSVATFSQGNQYTGAISLTCFPSFCGTTDDSSLITSFKYGGYSSITFSNGYSQDDGSVDTCGIGAWNWGVTQSIMTDESVSVGVTGSAGAVTATGSLGLTWASGSSSSTSFTYSIPGDSGTYYYDNLDGAGVGPISGALSWDYASGCSGGGGGCVLTGTHITLADRRIVPVQDLKPGDQLLSWNVTTDRPVITTVTSVYPTYVGSLLSIDHGLLIASGLNDQPVYARMPNGSQGWVLVGNLVVGSSLFDPLTHSWIPVTSLQYQNGTYQLVYSVGTSAPNNYIGNGVLLDLKT